MARPTVSEELTVIYDGPALTEHRMSVRDLAPALLGFADAVERAQALTAPGLPIRLEVQATEAASFDVNLILNDIPELYRQAVAVFSGPEVTAAVQLTEIVKSVVGAIVIAVAALRHLGKPRPEPVPPATPQDPPRLKLTFPDGHVLEATHDAWLVYNDGQAMAGLREAVRPLSDGNVETFAISHRGSRAVIDSSERGAFETEPAQDEEVLLDRIDPMMLQPVDITFRRGGKWKVSNGTSRFFVTVEDGAFVDRVEKGAERFGKADIFHARVRTVQMRTQDGLRTEHAIVQVVEHILGGVQQTLDLGGSD